MKEGPERGARADGELTPNSDIRRKRTSPAQVVGSVAWTTAFVELFVLIFLPSIRLWLNNR